MATPDKPLEQMTAQERLKLGRSLYKDGKFDEAIAVWSNITRDDDPETYAWVQLNLGNVYKDQGEVDKATTTWSKIPYDNNPSGYARAQFNLGNAYKDNGNLEKTIAAWNKVLQKDNPEAHAQAQLNLGNTYADRNRIDKAIAAWNKVLQKDNPEAHAQAQLNLGNTYKDKKDFEKAKEIYCKERYIRYYESICSLNIIACPEKIHEYLNELYDDITKILKNLQIFPEFEPKVAHYSRSSTAFNLLKNNQPSNFRLSTIHGVNDPTEGTILGNYFQKQNIIYENIHATNIATFISCFTFNHDSLNQFRLYGKEKGREATGVSLVFKKDFFDNQYSHLGFITHLPFISSCPTKESGTPSKPEDRQDKSKIEKVSLYRCIYLDPETGYLTLSHRDKSTFHLQHKEDKIDAEEQWKKYSEKISEKEKLVKNYLLSVKDSIQNILSTTLKAGYSANQKEEILKTVRSILLPLQYLVKHIAFQEEQECRIMYITHIYDEKVHSDWEKQWMYVEYEACVRDHIDKIWLSPGAAKYQDFFRILLDQGSGKSKVRTSQNPFRNKE